MRCRSEEQSDWSDQGHCHLEIAVTEVDDEIAVS